MNYNMSRLTFSILVSQLHAGCEMPCLRCEARFRLDVAALAMTYGRETIGFFCPRCLTTQMRERLALTARGKVTG